MPRIDTLSKAKLEERYPKKYFNPHTDNKGIMSKYNRATTRDHGSVTISGKLTGKKTRGVQC